MNSRERVLSAFHRRGYDRIPIKHEGTPEVNRMLMEHFGLSNLEQLLRVLGDDFRYVEPVYSGPELRTFPDGSVEGYFGERYKYAQFKAGKYLEACYLPFAGIDRLEALDRSHFPSADWFDYSTIRGQAAALRQAGFAVCCGTAGDMDFINGIARARGMEQVLMDLIDDNPVYLEIMQARFEFFSEVQRRILEAAGGLIDFCHSGEDFGNQRGPMIGLPIFERHFAPKYGPYFDMVHSHGARTMMHMCGCVEKFLPRLTAGRSACSPRWRGGRRKKSSARSAAGSNCFATGDCFSVQRTLSKPVHRWITFWPCIALQAVWQSRLAMRFCRSATRKRLARST
jgi:uroporphyrinogen decarboxylase